MKTCKKCNKEFSPTKGLINYCSLECRNSRVWSDEDKQKKSISAKNSEKLKESNKNRPRDLWEKIGRIRKENHRNKIIELEYGLLSFNSLRYRSSNLCRIFYSIYVFKHHFS